MAKSVCGCGVTPMNLVEKKNDEGFNTILLYYDNKLFARVKKKTSKLKRLGGKALKL